MQIKIKKNSDEEIVVHVSKNLELIISPKRENLTLNTINQFLVKLSSYIPENEIIEIANEVEIKNDLLYEHVVFLFSEFAKAFNSEAS